MHIEFVIRVPVPTKSPRLLSSSVFIVQFVDIITLYYVEVW